MFSYYGNCLCTEIKIKSNWKTKSVIQWILMLIMMMNPIEIFSSCEKQTLNGIKELKQRESSKDNDSWEIELRTKSKWLPTKLTGHEWQLIVNYN